MKTAFDFQFTQDSREVFYTLRDEFLEDFKNQVSLAKTETDFSNWMVSRIRAYNRVWNEVCLARPDMDLKENAFQSILKRLLLESEEGEKIPESMSRALAYIKG